MAEAHLASQSCRCASLRILADTSGRARVAASQVAASRGSRRGPAVAEVADTRCGRCLPWPAFSRIKHWGAGVGGGGRRRGRFDPRVGMTESRASPREHGGRIWSRSSSQGSKKKSCGELPLPEEIDDLIKQGLFASSAGQPLRQLRLSPGRFSPVLNASMAMAGAASAGEYFSHAKSNGGVFNGGVASPPVDRIKSSSSSLSEMMAQEQEMQKLLQNGGVHLPLPLPPSQQGQPETVSVQKKQLSAQERVDLLLLSESGCQNQFNDAASSDVKLTLIGRDGFRVAVLVHRHVLSTHSRFFAARLSERWSKQHRSHPQLIEISDCDNVELYLKTVRLMYCGDLKRSLMKENVTTVLEILKVSAAVVFEGAIAACLEYLEAMPWAEDEEQKLVTTLSQLQLESSSLASQVLTRINPPQQTADPHDIPARLILSVTKSTDEKARREMKALVSKLLRETISPNRDLVDATREPLYLACHNCLDSLLHLFMQATSPSLPSKDSSDRTNFAVQIARQADNLHWLIDILIDFNIADDFVHIWAHQSELAALHPQLPTMYRYGVSRLTARLCVGIGKASIWASKEVRFLLLQTWLQPLVEDFGWMQRCCKAVDKREVEEGISQTILTLPMRQQQNMLLAWLDRFAANGDDCPNLHKALEVWWRRTFIRPCLDDGIATAR